MFNLFYRLIALLIQALASELRFRVGEVRGERHHRLLREGAAGGVPRQGQAGRVVSRALE